MPLPKFSLFIRAPYLLIQSHGVGCDVYVCVWEAEKLTTRDPLEKQMAEQKKERRIAEAELRKQVAREQNYAEMEAARARGLTTGVTSGDHWCQCPQRSP